jgi:hypothetical protein
MKKTIRVTVRMGWDIEIDTKETSKAQIEEELRNELNKYVPNNGKIDIDVR